MNQLKLKPEASCPCCSGKSFSDCCGPLLSREKIAATPEQLMRSRYAAYTVGDIDYVMETMRGKAAKESDEESMREWSRTAIWQGLEIVDAPTIANDATEGEVEFIARYHSENKDHVLRERSQFVKKDGAWFYVDGHFPVEQAKKSHKVGANDPCPCGSGKKYKKCCRA